MLPHCNIRISINILHVRTSAHPAKYGNYNSLPVDTTHAGDATHKFTWIKYDVAATGHIFWSLYDDGHNHVTILLLSCTSEFLGDRYVTFTLWHEPSVYLSVVPNSEGWTLSNIFAPPNNLGTLTLCVKFDNKFEGEDCPDCVLDSHLDRFYIIGAILF